MNRIFTLILALLLVIFVFSMTGCEIDPQNPTETGAPSIGGIESKPTSPTQTSPSEPTIKPTQQETEPSKPPVVETNPTDHNLVSEIIGKWKCYENRGSQIPFYQWEFLENGTFIQTEGKQIRIGQYIVPDSAEGVITLSYGFSHEAGEETVQNYYARFDKEKLLISNDLDNFTKHYAIFSRINTPNTGASDKKLAKSIVGSWINKAEFDGYMNTDYLEFWDNGTCCGGYIEYEFIEGEWQAFGGNGWYGTYEIRNGALIIYEHFEQQYGPESARASTFKVRIEGDNLIYGNDWGESVYTKEADSSESHLQITGAEDILGTWNFNYGYYDESDYLTIIFHDDGTCQFQGNKGSFSGRYSFMSGRLLVVLESENGPQVLVQYLTCMENTLYLRSYITNSDGIYESIYEYTR